MNRQYGKIESGRLVYAPSSLPSTITDEDGQEISAVTYNPSDYLYRLNGWSPIVKDPRPDDEDGAKSYEPVYVQENGTIYQRWREQYLPPAPPTIEEQVEANAEAIMELAELIGGMLQ